MIENPKPYQVVNGPLEGKFLHYAFDGTENTVFGSVVNVQVGDLPEWYVKYLTFPAREALKRTDHTTTVWVYIYENSLYFRLNYAKGKPAVSFRCVNDPEQTFALWCAIAEKQESDTSAFYHILAQVKVCES
jgi:hypothetical protein